MARLIDVKYAPELSEAGVPRVFPGTDWEIMIARHGAPHVVDFHREYRANFEGDPDLLDDEESPEGIEFANQTLANCIIRGWKNLEEESPGNLEGIERGAVAIEATLETKLEYLRDPDMSHWREWIMRLSLREEQYRLRNREAVLGNS